VTINNDAGLFESGYCNENNLNPLARINWRASLVPAAAVIPAPMAYIKVVAVKKLVVGFLAGATGRPIGCVLVLRPAIFAESVCGIKLSCSGPASFTVRKLECSKQAYALDMLAWNNKIRLWRSILLVCTPL
jgi:hypothetical protein